MGRVIRSAARWLAYVSAGSASFMAFAVSVDVIRRTVEGQGFRGITDLTVLLLVVIAFGGFAHAEVEEAHVRVTLLSGRLRGPARRVVRSLAMLVTLVFVTGLAYGTGARALASLRTGEATIGLVRFLIWPSRTMIAIGCAALAVVVLHKTIVVLRDRLPPDPAAPSPLPGGEGVARSGTGGR